MNVTARQLRAFLTAARLGSFTRAAEEVAVTQSGFSLMVKELEGQIGARLFDRTTRSVHITEAGAKLLPVAQRMISELESVIASIDRMSDQARRELTIAATPVMAASILPGICRDFSNAHPYVRLHVRDVGRKEILSLVESGEADLGLGAFFKPASGIARKRIGRFRLIYLTATSTGGYKGAEEAKPSEIPWAMLPDEPLISLPSDNPIQQVIDGCLKDAGRSIEQRDLCNNLLTAIALVEAGYGSAIVPSFVLPMCERFEVTCQTLGSPVAPIDFFMVTKKGREASDLVAMFADAVSQTMTHV